MQQSPRKDRSHPPPLPAWLPGWLLACLAVGASTSITFYFGLQGLNWKGVVGCFGFGFGFMLVILTLTQGRAKPADQPSSFFPPLWVRHPVVAALLVGIAAMWVDKQKITTGASHGNRVLVEGPAAIALSIVVMAAPVPGTIWLLRRKPRALAAVIGAVAALLVVAAGLGFAVLRIVQVYG